LTFVLWLLAAILVIGRIVALVRGAVLYGIVLIGAGLLVGPGGVPVFTSRVRQAVDIPRPGDLSKGRVRYGGRYARSTTTAADHADIGAWMCAPFGGRAHGAEAPSREKGTGKL
jgi:hypothetical protein